MTDQELIAKFCEDIKEQHKPPKKSWDPCVWREDAIRDYIDAPLHTAFERIFREQYLGNFINDHMEYTLTALATPTPPMGTGEIND